MDDWTLRVATLIIAAWGALLSTFLGIKTLLAERRKVHIVSTAIMYLNEDGSARSGLDVRFINEGRRPIELINSCGVVTLDGSHFSPMSIDPRTGERMSNLPKMLSDGESIKVFFQADSFDGGYLPKKVFVRDTSGREHMARVNKKHRTSLTDMIENGAFLPSRRSAEEGES